MALCALVLAWPAWADVTVKTLPDGTKLIVGEGRPRSGSRPVARPRSAPVEVEAWIHENAERLDLDADLIRAVMQVESGFDPRATSHKGAMGLMQLMPQTAAMLAVNNPYDPRQNVRGGADYLRRMLQRFGRVDLALAAYNAGPTAVERYGGIPPYRETRAYVEKVLRIHRHDPSYRLPDLPRSGGGARSTYLYRGPDGRLVMTTEPPK